MAGSFFILSLFTRYPLKCKLIICTINVKTSFFVLFSQDMQLCPLMKCWRLYSAQLRIRYGGCAICFSLFMPWNDVLFLQVHLCPGVQILVGKCWTPNPDGCHGWNLHFINSVMASKN